MAKALQKQPRNADIRKVYYINLRHYKEMKKLKEKAYKEKLMSEIDDLHSNKSSEYWKLLDDLKKSSASPDNIEKISIQEWQHYFTKLHQESKMKEHRKCQNNLELEMLGKCKSFNETDYPITEKEIKDAIKKLKNNKSTGLDKINNEMLKYSQHVLLPNIKKIFNSILCSGIYPTSWKEGYIVPIYKSGNPLDPINYRGITILNCLGKLLNSVLNNRLTSFLIKNNIISKTQIGFEKDSRTSDHIFTLKALIDKYTKNKKKVYACFIDFKKAFDTVDHNALMLKLKRAGIGDLMLETLKSLYTKTKPNMMVKIKDTLTNYFKVDVGVNQGDPLSPTLFKLFINDITDYFDNKCDPVKLGDNNINCLLYADDIIVLSETKNGLQNACNKIANFCQDWSLEVNCKKTKVMFFSANGKQNKDEITYQGKTLEKVKSYKYLGILLTSSGSFTKAKEDLYQRGSKASFKLMKLINSNKLSYNTTMHLFDHTVRPVLLYGSEIWAPLSNHESAEKIIKQTKDSIIEKCHLKFCRFALGVSKKAPNTGIYGETGRKPLHFEPLINMIKYWHRLNNCTEKLIYQALQENKILNAQKQNCWLKKLLELAKTLKIGVISPDISKEEMFRLIRNLRVKLISNFNQNWKADLTSNRPNATFGNKLRTYRSFKSYPSEEKYLSSLKAKEDRVILAKFRLSAHTLNIEKLRYTPRGQRIPPELRLCTLCDLKHIEDETHLLFECPIYADIRSSLLNKLDKENPSFNNLSISNKTLWCLSNEHTEIISETATFLKKAFKRRATLEK